MHRSIFTGCQFFFNKTTCFRSSLLLYDVNNEKPITIHVSLYNEITVLQKTFLGNGIFSAYYTLKLNIA